MKRHSPGLLSGASRVLNERLYGKNKLPNLRVVYVAFRN